MNILYSNFGASSVAPFMRYRVRPKPSRRLRRHRAF